MIVRKPVYTHSLPISNKTGFITRKSGLLLFYLTRDSSDVHIETQLASSADLLLRRNVVVSGLEELIS